jgi:hypothetical protein
LAVDITANDTQSWRPAALLAVILGGIVITKNFGIYAIKILRHDRGLRDHGTEDRLIAWARRLEAQVSAGGRGLR